LNQGGCHQGRSSRRIELADSPDAFAHLQPGQAISMAVEAPALCRMAARAYLLPAVCIVSGAGIATSMAESGGDLAALAGAFLGLLVGCGLLRLYDARSRRAGWEAHHPAADAVPQMCFKES
jgi:positive regulator of sigma E activity